MAGEYAFDPKPSPEALAFLKSKRLKPGFSYKDVWGEEHAYNFTVAKMLQADLLKSVQQSLVDAQAAGQTFRDWAKGIQPELARRGWWGMGIQADPKTGEEKLVQLGSPRRLRTIYDANMRSARAAGQWERFQRTKTALPYLLYELGPSERHRPEHVARAGKIAPIDDPIWQYWMPPNGWGCKCRVRQVGRTEATRRGFAEQPPLTASDMTDWTNNRTGETFRIPKGIDPAWANNAGLARQQGEATRLLGEKLIDANPATAAALWDGAAKSLTPGVTQDWQRFVDRYWNAPQAAARDHKGGARFVAGMLKPQVVDALKQRGVIVSSAAITIDDKQLLHLSRTDKLTAAVELPDRSMGKGVAISREDMGGLPAILAEPEAVLLDRERGNIEVVFQPSQDDGRLGRIIIETDKRVPVTPSLADEKRTKPTVNSITTAGLARPANVYDENVYDVLWKR